MKPLLSLTASTGRNIRPDGALKPANHGKVMAASPLQPSPPKPSILSILRTPQPPSGVLTIPLPIAKKSNPTKFRG